MGKPAQAEEHKCGKEGIVSPQRVRLCLRSPTLIPWCLQVAAFPCLQPFLGTLLAFSLLGEAPSWWDLGAVGIVAGLLLTARAADGPTPELLSSSTSVDRDLEPILTRED